MSKFLVVKIPWVVIIIVFEISLPIYFHDSCNFYDDFSTFNTEKWDIFSGLPFIENGQLVLISNLANHIKTEVQSKIDTFLYGRLEITVSSSNWKSGYLNDIMDTSFGFEIWSGNAGSCHNGIVITNGTLGILRTFPVTDGSCSGVPIFQKYFSIPDWDTLRKTTNKYTLIWTKERIDLIINDSLTVPHDIIPQDSIPNRPMRIRLNCNVDLDHNHGVTVDTLTIDKVCYKNTNTSVIGSDGNLMLKEFSLRQNFPNPFNPETTIKYEIPKPVGVIIIIYNLLGQKVRTLVSEEKMAGAYLVKWDGKDDFSRPVSRGVYLYRISAEQFIQTKKMVLLR